MYTGLVQEVGKIISLSRGNGYTTVVVRASVLFLSALHVGGSISVNGVCLSATKIEDDTFHADITNTTLAISNLKNCKLEDGVNLERSAVSGAEVGGHLIAGHVDGTGSVTKITKLGDAMEMLVAVPKEILKYIFKKGFLALNGASLTVVSVEQETQTVKITLIPETLRQTTFSSIKIEDQINIEVEPTSRVLVDTMERLVAPIVEELARKVSEKAVVYGQAAILE